MKDFRELNVWEKGNYSGAKWQRHIGTKGYSNTRKVLILFFTMCLPE